jgi:hypothetical protein
MILVTTVTEQNYFHFNVQYNKQKIGITMGAPTSAILAEIFVQYLQHIRIINILTKHHMICYYWYVNDILLIYNTQHTEIKDA